MKLQKVSVTYQVFPIACKVVARVESRIVDASGFPCHTFATVGVARTCNEPFNEGVGKRLARARAEKKAHILFRDWLRRRLRLMSVQEIEYSRALFKTLAHIEKQKAYIKSF